MDVYTDLTGKVGKPQLPKWRLVSLYVSISCGLFLAFLDTSIVATSLYRIGSDFMRLSEVNWVALAYTLAYLGCTAVFASLANVFGRREVYLSAFVIFLVASLACGWARNLNQLIAFRTLQGVGGSGLYSVGLVILPEISPPKMLKMVGTIAGVVLAVSGVLGPVLGGIITQYTSWRWIFWINAPLGIVPLLLFAFAWPSSEEMTPWKRQSIRQMDFLGFFLLIAASVPFVFAFQQVGIHILEGDRAWSAAIFLAPLLVGVVCFVALFGWEYVLAIRGVESIHALFPARMAKSRAYVSAVISTMLMGFPYLAVVYILPLHFQIVNKHTPLASGIALLPMLGSVAIGSAISGPIVARVKNSTFPIMFTGSALMLIGTATLATLDVRSSHEARAYGLQVFVGLGFGLTISTSSMIASAENERRDNATAQGIMAQARMFGGSLGIAAFTAILSTKQRHELIDPKIVKPWQLSIMETVPLYLPHEDWEAILKTYSDSVKQALMVCAIVAGLAMLLSVCFWDRNAVNMQDKINRWADENDDEQEEGTERKDQGQDRSAV